MSVLASCTSYDGNNSDGTYTSGADNGGTAQETESSAPDSSEEISTDTENIEELMITSPNGIQYSYVKEAKDYLEAKNAFVISMLE